jgi:thioredoxin-related protein
MLSRCVLGLCALAMSALPWPGEAAGTREVYVPLAQDLSTDGRAAKERGLPILLLMAAEYCTYCKYVEQNFLKPMISSGDHKDKVLIRIFYIDGHQPIRDFDGSSVTPEALAARYRVQLTPTVLFLGPGGQELAERLVGISSKDFYGVYLEQGIDAALAKLGGVS